MANHFSALKRTRERPGTPVNRANTSLLRTSLQPQSALNGADKKAAETSYSEIRPCS